MRDYGGQGGQRGAPVARLLSCWVVGGKTEGPRVRMRVRVRGGLPEGPEVEGGMTAGWRWGVESGIRKARGYVRGRAFQEGQRTGNLLASPEAGCVAKHAVYCLV